MTDRYRDRINSFTTTFMRPSCPRLKLATHYDTLAVPQNATKVQIKVCMPTLAK